MAAVATSLLCATWPLERKSFRLLAVACSARSPPVGDSSAIFYKNQEGWNKFNYCDLIQSAKINSTKVLRIYKCRIKKEYDADIIVCKLPDEIKDEKELCTQVILHTKDVSKVYINGEQYA